MTHIFIQFSIISSNTRIMIKMLKQHTLLQGTKLFLSTKSKTHYDTLKISPNATHNEIKSAYYKLTLQYHPDRNKSKEAKATFQNISSAYQVLSNFQLRKQYDRTIAIRYADINKIQRPAEGDYTAKTMHRMYDYDEWLRTHYGRSFDRRKALKQQYAEYLIHKQREKELDEQTESSSKTAVILAAILLIIMFITDRNIINNDKPKPKND